MPFLALTMLLLGLYLGLAIGVSFLCSILEAVFLSISPTSLVSIQKEQPRAGALLTRLRENVDRPLVAILTLNTVAHTVGAAGVGAQAGHLWGSASLGWVSAGLTFLILVLSEIIPKTLGATHWRRLALPASYAIQGLVWLTLPFVWMAQGLTGWIARGNSGPRLRRDELSAVAEAGRLEGIFSEDEARVVRNLVGSWRRPVYDILTPRTVVAALSADHRVGQARAEVEERPFSRFPVYQDTIDHLKGFVLKDDLLAAAAKGEEERPVRDFLRPILIIPSSASVSATYRQMLKRHEHLAAAVDEYGGLDGLVTMEDILETLLGQEIVDEVDTVVDMRAWAREDAARRSTLPTAPPPSARGR